MDLYESILLQFGNPALVVLVALNVEQAFGVAANSENVPTDEPGKAYRFRERGYS